MMNYCNGKGLQSIFLCHFFKIVFGLCSSFDDMEGNKFFLLIHLSTLIIMILGQGGF